MCVIEGLAEMMRVLGMRWLDLSSLSYCTPRVTMLAPRAFGRRCTRQIRHGRRGGLINRQPDVKSEEITRNSIYADSKDAGRSQRNVGGQLRKTGKGRDTRGTFGD